MLITCANCGEAIDVPNELIGSLESVDQIEPYICDACENQSDLTADDLDHEIGLCDELAERIDLKAARETVRDLEDKISPINKRIAELEAAGGELYRIWKCLEPGLDIAIPKDNLLRIAARIEIDKAIKAWEALAVPPSREDNHGR